MTTEFDPPFVVFRNHLGDRVYVDPAKIAGMHSYSQRLGFGTADAKCWSGTNIFTTGGEFFVFLPPEEVAAELRRHRG